MYWKCLVMSPGSDISFGMEVIISVLATCDTKHNTQPLRLIHEQKETLSHATRLVPWVTLLSLEMKNNLNLRRKLDHSLAELTDFGDSFSFILAASHQNETAEN